MQHKTILAHWIDTVALCALILMGGFGLLYSRSGNFDVALMLSLISALLFTPAIRSILAMLKERHRSWYSPALGRRAALYIISKAPDAVCSEFEGWLAKPDCRATAGAVPPNCARLITRHPDSPFTAQDALEAWQARAGNSGTTDIYVTADITDSAFELAKRLSAPEMRLHPLRDVCALARPYLPPSVLDNPPPPPLSMRLRALYDSLIHHNQAGRYAVYGLGMLFMGRFFGLPYVRLPGLLCLIMWLLCTAQPSNKAP